MLLLNKYNVSVFTAYCGMHGNVWNVLITFVTIVVTFIVYKLYYLYKEKHFVLTMYNNGTKNSQ